MFGIGINKLGVNRTGRQLFDPVKLFLSDEEGTFLDFTSPQVYADTAGTDPAEVGEGIALTLDKSQGGELGAEQFDAAFATETAGVVQDGTSNNWTMTAATQNNSAIAYDAGFTANVGKLYSVSFEIYDYVSGSIAGRLQGLNGPSFSGNGIFEYKHLAIGSGNFIGVTVLTTATLKLRNISVRELPGVHALQSTSTARPIFARVPSSGRRNLLERTEEFDNAYWTKLNATVTANDILAPDGTLTADKLLETTTVNVHRAQSGVFTPVAGRVHIASIFVLGGLGRDWFSVQFDFGGVNTTRWFDVANGVVGGSAGVGGDIASIEDAGDGWYRCSMSRVVPTSAAGVIRPHIASADLTNSYAGDTSKGLYLWGAQLEVAA